MTRIPFRIAITVLVLFTTSLFAAHAQEQEPLAPPSPATFAPGDVIPTPEPMEDLSEESLPAEPAVTPPGEEPEEAKAPRFVVFLPERIEQQWYWFFYADESQHIVQSEVEKAFARAGLELLDISASDSFGGRGSIDDLVGKNTAVAKAAAMGADYVVVGTAIADKQSSGTAYGVTVVRATANITARIVRVSDGKIMAVEDAAALEGGQALAGAARDALKKAGREIAGKLLRAAKSILDQP